MGDEGFEHRGHPRIRRRRKIGLVLANGDVEYMWTMDLSQGGLQLHTEHVIDMGREFPVVIGLYDSRAEEYVTVRARMRVVHKVYDGEYGAFRIGMEFLSFERDGEEVYAHHLSELEMKLH